MPTAAPGLTRWQRLGITIMVMATVLTVTLVACGGGQDEERVATGTTSPSASPPSGRSASATPDRSTAATPHVAKRRSTAANAPLAGMPPVADPKNIYADAGPGMLSRAMRKVPYRIYVPNSEGSSVTVIDPRTMQVIRTFGTGENPQHVVPSWDMKTLWVTNDRANSLTRIDPMTGRRKGPNIPVDDPYNMYFTPDGKYALVVAEARQHLDFRDPKTWKLKHRITVDCPGIDHIDFSANGGYLIATCEFSGKLVKVNLHTRKVCATGTCRAGARRTSSSTRPARCSTSPTATRAGSGSSTPRG